MVEYGAGGQLVQPTEETAAGPTSGTAATETADGEAAPDGLDADGETAAAPAPTPASVPRPPRRRRRAKGWHCPVCRQRKSIAIALEGDLLSLDEPRIDVLSLSFYSYTHIVYLRSVHVYAADFHSGAGKGELS